MVGQGNHNNSGGAPLGRNSPWAVIKIVVLAALDNGQTFEEYL
jgi:hypothetical protein